MFRLCRSALLPAMFIASPVLAQVVNDARQTARTSWSAEKLTAQVVKGCGIPRTYFAINREFDGYARFRESPSVTPEQHKCATTIVQRFGIPIRK